MDWFKIQVIIHPLCLPTTLSCWIMFICMPYEDKKATRFCLLEFNLAVAISPGLASSSVPELFYEFYAFPQRIYRALNPPSHLSYINNPIPPFFKLFINIWLGTSRETVIYIDYVKITKKIVEVQANNIINKNRTVKFNTLK